MIHQMIKEGLSKSAIARKLGLSTIEIPLQLIFVQYTKNNSITALNFKDYGDVFGDVLFLTAFKCRK